MAELLIALLVVTLFSVLLAVIALALGARALRKRNRVSPAVATNAPTSWLGAPGAGARLHRRLRTAVTVARAACATAPSAPHLVDLTADLEREAVALDTHLVIASRIHGKQGRIQMATLAQQVRKVEQVASQVSLLAAQSQAPMIARGEGSALDDLARQLDRLEQARHEVTEVETAAGVHRVSPYATPPGADPTRATPDLRKAPPGQTMPGGG
ncbi:MAG TPA: hypothetical protein VGO60_10750 [Iamia sp.]|jgi:hypothetical protein|nr:hypothetical protein [Iamia sp.]